MSKKNNKAINRRSFISDTGKTLLYGSFAATAIPLFLEGCGKNENCNVLKEGDEGNHYCNDNYICTDSRGFACPAPGGYQCGPDDFSCFTVFSCTPENKFFCQPDSSYSHNVGGSGS